MEERNSKVSPFHAGQLKNKINLWNSLRASTTITNILNGYRIPFVRKPPLTKLSQAKNKILDPSKTMSQQISNLLEMGAISVNKFNHGYLSPIFLREKSNGSHRLILNLKNLNFYVDTPKFRLVSLRKVSQIIQKGDYMVKIDISNAYYHIPVWDSHRRYLSFAFGNNIYNMNCLPFGLSSAPSVFSKISNWVASLLREEGIRTIVYLDDFLLLNKDAKLLAQQAQWTIGFLQDLGWHINLSKTNLTPTPKIEYLGLYWDSTENKKSLPDSKVSNIRDIITLTLCKNSWSWLSAKQLLGKLNFASNTVPLGALHCRSIQIAAKQLPDSQRNKVLQLPNIVKEELFWWFQNVNKSSTLQIAAPSAFVATDASGIGWGAIVNGKKLSGHWNTYQDLWHSNQKELWVFFEVLQRECTQLRGKTVIFQTDNRTAAAYIRRQGGTKSRKLLNMTAKILNLARSLDINVVPKYLPGKYNGLADSLSRLKTQQEWHLDVQMQTLIFQKMGTPEIDLFSSKASAVVPRYVSEDLKDTTSEYTDAFSRPWEYKLGWIFPPPALIPQVLQHMNISSGHYLLIVPNWEKAHWKPVVKKRALCPPLRIKNLKAHLRDLRTNLPPRDIQNLRLEVWKVRAGPLK